MKLRLYLCGTMVDMVLLTSNLMIKEQVGVLLGFEMSFKFLLDSSLRLLNLLA